MHEGKKMAIAVPYHHLQLKKLWVSICKECFLTAAQAEAETELFEREQAHRCSESLMDRTLASEDFEDFLVASRSKKAS